MKDKFEKDITNGFLINCCLQCREGDEVLYRRTSDGKVLATLDGYAIIPLEEYGELTGEDFSKQLERVTPTLLTTKETKQ